MPEVVTVLVAAGAVGVVVKLAIWGGKKLAKRTKTTADDKALDFADKKSPWVIALLERLFKGTASPTHIEKKAPEREARRDHRDVK